MSVMSKNDLIEVISDLVEVVTALKEVSLGVDDKDWAEAEERIRKPKKLADRSYTMAVRLLFEIHKKFLMCTKCNRIVNPELVVWTRDKLGLDHSWHVNCCPDEETMVSHEEC